MKFYENMEGILRYFTTSGGFLTSEKDGIYNTMTISWGGVGFLWNKSCFNIYVRPQRYTKQFIDTSKNFTVSVPFGNMKNELSIVGTKSGTEINKSEVVNFIPSKSVSSPIVEGCDAYFECVVRHVQRFDEALLSDEVKKKVYPNEDYHYIYFGEIVERY